MELVKELKECLSWLEAVAMSFPVAEVETFSSILACFDFWVTGEEALPSVLLSLALLEELELVSPLVPFLSFFDF